MMESDHGLFVMIRHNDTDPWDGRYVENNLDVDLSAPELTVLFVRMPSTEVMMWIHREFQKRKLLQIAVVDRDNDGWYGKMSDQIFDIEILAETGESSFSIRVRDTTFKIKG